MSSTQKVEAVRLIFRREFFFASSFHHQAESTKTERRARNETLVDKKFVQPSKEQSCRLAHIIEMGQSH